MRKATVHERFAGKFSPEPISGCWLWTSIVNKYGYGVLHNSRNHGVRVGYSSAHRVSWEIYRGEIPDGMCVLHNCDTPLCVNPDHLHLGTNEENTQEKVSRNRQYIPAGQTHPGCKITEEIVKEIRATIPKGVSFRFGCKRGMRGETPLVKAANKYGISVGHVRAIVSRAAWSHI